MWNNLADEIKEILYPGTESYHDVLKLAQEYETGFGRGALHKFLRERVRNDDFEPVKAHIRLLKLPWRDVFTTNWDTLLERTAERIAERPYSVIRDKSEIPLLGQPRIVKLHGSLPAHFPLIFTEEDYRTYPRKFASFVNTVQQAMMETVFCLIGFSGNDPNFLQWSGWVRDNLGDAAPKIYLAGWLDLSVHRRRMLEGLGVVPIDLARHPQAAQWPEMQRDQYATEWILETLERGEPYNLAKWPAPPERRRDDIPDYLHPVIESYSNVPVTQPDPFWQSGEMSIEQLVGKVREVIDAWAHNRKMYPDWLVCPTNRRFSWDTDLWERHILAVLDHVKGWERLPFIRELTWRREIQLEPIDASLESAAGDVLESVDCVIRAIDGVPVPDADWSALRTAWVEVGLALLTAARLNCNQTLFMQRLEALRPFEHDSANVGHRIHHEQCLLAIYSSDFGRLNELMDTWDLENADSAWMLRKSALLSEAGRIEESRVLIENTLESTRSAQAGNQDIANASRESWALASTVNDENRREVFRRWDELALLNCNAWTEKEAIERALGNSIERQKAPSFELGVIHSVGTSISGEGTRRINDAFRAIRLLEVAGLPLTNNPPMGNVSLPTSMVSVTKLSVPDILASSAPELAIRLVLRFCKYDQDDSLNLVLSRSRIAALTSESAEALADVCIGLIAYAMPRLTEQDGRILGAWVEKMRVALEVLSRLALRTEPSKIEEILDVGLNYYRTPGVSNHTMLARPASNLLERSWHALPRELQTERALDMLGAPISGMEGFSAGREFVDPGRLVSDFCIEGSRTKENHFKFDEVVGHLVRALNDDDKDVRAQAVMRLVPMAESACLTESESLEIANALWGNRDPIHESPNGDFIPHWVYFILPSLKFEEVDTSFRRRWLTDTGNSQGDLAYSGMVICQVGLAIDASRDQGFPFALSSDEEDHLTECVMRIVDGLIVGTWHSQGVNPSSIIDGMRAVITNIKLAEDVAEDIFLKSEHMTSMQNNGRLGGSLLGARFVHDLMTAVKYAVVPGLLKALPDRFDDIVSQLRTGMASSDESEVHRAMWALDSWMVESARGLLSDTPPPSDLIREIGTTIATRRKAALPNALISAKLIFEEGSEDFQEMIGRWVVRGLDSLASELIYERIHADEMGNRSEFGDDLPTLRLLCVQLAVAMKESELGRESAVARWLEMGSNDPLPEVRNALELSESQQH